MYERIRAGFSAAVAEGDGDALPNVPIHGLVGHDVAQRVSVAEAHPRHRPRQPLPRRLVCFAGKAGELLAQIVRSACRRDARRQRLANRDVEPGGSQHVGKLAEHVPIVLVSEVPGHLAPPLDRDVVIVKPSHEDVGVVR